MACLAHERQNLAKSLDEYWSLIVPIRRISQEMLSAIFRHCVMSSARSIESDIEPLLLTFVCSRWRRVAIFSPQLRSAIWLPYDRPSVNMLEIWLSQSGTSPLKLDVESENNNNNIIHTLIFFFVSLARRVTLIGSSAVQGTCSGSGQSTNAREA
jgi:hypothetical protein